MFHNTAADKAHFSSDGLQNKTVNCWDLSSQREERL